MQGDPEMLRTSGACGTLQFRADSLAICCIHMHRRWCVAIDALSGQSELGSLAVETCIRWRAPSRAPRGSGAGNRQTRSVETPCVRYLRSVACRTEARSAARCRGNLIRDTHVRHGSRFALVWESLYLRRRCPASPIRSRRPASAIAN